MVEVTKLCFPFSTDVAVRLQSCNTLWRGATGALLDNAALRRNLGAITLVVSARAALVEEVHDLLTFWMLLDICTATAGSQWLAVGRLLGHGLASPRCGLHITA